MPSQLDSNQLVEAYKKKFGNMFFHILQKLLTANDAIIAGGAVLAPYDKSGKTNINDLDIYVHERNAQSLFTQLSNIKLTPDMLFGFISNHRYNTLIQMIEENPNAVERINTDEGATSDNILLTLFEFETNDFNTKLQPPYDQSFFVKNNILLRLPMNGRGFTDRSPMYLAVDPSYIWQFPSIKIDLLVVDDSVPLTSVPENFDLSFCKVWWNGNDVFATNPDDISNKRGTLSPDYVSSLLQGNRFTLNRISKYKNRGFKVIIPNMCIPEQLLEKQTKEVISDERWVVSKIIEGIETIFNTKKIINNAFRIVGSDRELISCFTGKKQTLIKEISQNNITKYDPTIFLMDALKNFNKDYQGPIFTMENINNLYIKLFELLELDLEGLRLLLNVNQRGIPDCNELSEKTNQMIEDKLIPPKSQFIEKIKTIFYKMWALQESSDNLDEFRRKNADKEIPENIKKEVLQRFFQIYTSKCQISTLTNIFEARVAGRGGGDDKGIFKKYQGIIDNAFPALDENNKLDKLIMGSNFLMNEVLQDKLRPIPYYATEVPECEYSLYINILFPEYIYNKKYKDKIEDQRISYVVYRNNSCSVPIKGYFKPTREFGGSIEPNQVFDNKEQCQEYKKQILAEQQQRTTEARQRAIAQYGDLTDPDVSGDVDDFVIPGGTYGVDEIPGKCYRAEDSGKDLSEKWYEKGNILFLMHFSEIDPNQEDLTVCVSKEYLEERMSDNTNIYYTCTGPRAEILNGPRRGQVIPIENLRPEDRYDRLPSGGSDAADVSNQDETFVKINMAEEQLRNERGEKTVDTTVPAYLRINDVRKIIQIVTENPDKTRIFSLLPDGERTHTVTKSVMLGGSIVGGFHCQNNSVINIFKVREFSPQTNAAGLWNDITEPPPAIYSPNTPSYTPDILAPFTRQQPEGSEIREAQRLPENTVIEDDGGLLQGEVERQDYDPDLDDLYSQLDALVEDEVVAINMGPADELGQRTQDLISDARSYLGQGWRDQLDEIRTPYSNEDIVFLSRLRRWLSESRRDRELRFWNPQDFRPDPPLVDNIEFTNWNEIAETFAGGAGSDSGSILELEDSDSEPDESNTARQLFADDQSVDEDNNQITQEEFENLITDTRMAIVNANLRMMRAGRPYRFIFSQDETANAYNLLGNATIENVDRIYELRRLIDERLQNLPNP
tara:strand:- start:4498 stop:8040 length:3543 start_codon:yes stop_codon:yes gene_type:complete